MSINIPPKPGALHTTDGKDIPEPALAAVQAQADAALGAGAKPKRPPLPGISVTSRNRRDAELLDLVEDTKDPNRVYRWVRCRADENMVSVARSKFQGYTVELTTGQVKTVADIDPRPDKAIVIGDLILMSCPKVLHDQRQEEQYRHREGILNSLSAETEEMAADKGISIIKDTDHNSKRGP